MRRHGMAPALGLTLALLLLVSQVHAQNGSSMPSDEPSAAAEREPDASPIARRLPVTRVVLFTAGVGYFEHSGTVEGTVELELPVAGDQMDDLLQSLVLQDFDGGTVEPVRYPARDPLGRVLASYSLDLSGDPTLADILSQARGEGVVVTASVSLRGTIVNVERVEPPEEEPKTYLTLATPDGLRRVSLAEVRGIRFQRSELQRELDDALAALARYRGDEERGVRLRFSGEGSRRVSVGYVREMPVWKTSYRLVLGDEGEAALQGWAIFDNPTSIDLEAVSVSFVAGQPLSFISRLYDPVYVERPRVEAITAPAIVPPAYAGDRPAPAAAREAEAAGDFLPAQAIRSALQDGAGVSAMAEGTAAGAGFEYRVSLPVTIPRYESAMIPIVQQRVDASTLSVYDPSLLAEHPLRGARLTNDTGLHLAAGPVTAFWSAEAGRDGFAGNARIEDIVPGDSRLITFAVDLDFELEAQGSSEPERVVAVALRNGMIETSTRQRVRTVYRASPRGDEDRFIVIVHPKRSGFEVVSPNPAPTETARDYRFGMSIGDASDREVPSHVECGTESGCNLTVVMERLVRQSLAVGNVGSEQIAFYLENVELGEADRELLSQILELKRRIAGLDERISAFDQQVAAIHRDQERIRQNMGALDRDSSLYLRYLSELEEQENELEAIHQEAEELRRERLRTQEELDRLVATFPG